MDHLTTRIRQLRVEKGLTQEELADQVGVVRQTVAYLERGEYMPSLAVAWRIARALGRPLEEVFELSEAN